MMNVDGGLPKDYNDFLARYPAEQVGKGSVLIAPDDEMTGLFFIESGHVSKYEVTKFGDQVVMNVFNAPTLIPLSWVLNKTPNHYYFEAVTPLTVRHIPTDEAEAYLKTNPAVLYKLLQQVYLGLENTQRRVMYLMRGTVRSRLLFELLIEARRAGQMRDDGSCVVAVSMSELTHRAGLSRETISRELAKVLRSGDLCRREGRSIVINDLARLDEMLRLSI